MTKNIASENNLALVEDRNDRVQMLKNLRTCKTFYEKVNAKKKEHCFFRNDITPLCSTHVSFMGLKGRESMT